MWDNQQSNLGTQIKLIVYFAEGQPKRVKTYYAFKNEEKKGTAIDGLTRRILKKSAFGKYQTAIFYDNGAEVERWVGGIKQ